MSGVAALRILKDLQYTIQPNIKWVEDLLEVLADVGEKKHKV